MFRATVSCHIKVKSQSESTWVQSTWNESKLLWGVLTCDMTRMTTKMYYNYYVPWQIKHSFHSCVGCGEELRTRLQRMIKQRCNRELNTLLSCGCLISGVSHRRHRNRVNANETWWKASPRVAQPVRTSSDYCTINHPSVNASAFIIRSPIRHPNLCSPSHKLQIRKRTQESVMRHTIHSDSQRSKEWEQ